MKLPGNGSRERGAAYEVHKRGVARFDYRDPYRVALTMSWPAFSAAALAMLLAINMLFAGLYLVQGGSVANLPPGDILGAFFFSLETLATVGYGVMSPATTYGHIVASAETVAGMAFMAIFTGLLFVRFSKPHSPILFAENAVVANHNGQPTLMIRIANGGLTMLANVHIRLGVLLQETTTEGSSYRRVSDLKLLRDFNPVFPLTAVLMHVIDDESPLAGFGRDQIIEHDVRLFLTIVAWDVALANSVQDIESYDCDHILFGMRYVDAISRDDMGRTIADISRLSQLEPEPPRL